MKTNIYFFIIFHSVLLRMLFQTEVIQKLKTRILSSINIFLKSCRLCDMWKNTVQPGRPQETWRICSACCMTKATSTNIEYVTHCFATATMVIRKRLDVPLYVLYSTLPVLLEYTFSPLRNRKVYRCYAGTYTYYTLQEV